VWKKHEIRVQKIERERERKREKYKRAYSDCGLQEWIGMQAWESPIDLSKFKNEFVTVGWCCRRTASII